MNLAIFYLLFSSFSSLGVEGYPNPLISIESAPGIGGVIKNRSCISLTIYVNNQNLYVPANSEFKLNSTQWSKWNWIPGKIGEMTEKTVLYPIKLDKKIDYGPNSGVTHRDEHEFSYDMFIAEGTPVYAMEGGTVIRVLEHFHLAHQDLARRNQVNLIEILHNDGTVGSYAHLKRNGVEVELCDKVIQGQLLGYSGNTGYSSGPHLHVQVFRPVGAGKFKTIPLKFLKN